MRRRNSLRFRKGGSRWISVILNCGYFTLVMCLCSAVGTPAVGQEVDSVRVRAQMQVEQQLMIEHIAQQVARAVLAGDDSLTVDQMVLVERVSSQLVQDMELFQAQKQQEAKVREESKELIKSIVLNVAKGIAIVIALLVLREIIGSIGKGVRAESEFSPLGVLITTRTEEKARDLGKKLVEEGLASGGTITPSVRSIYRRDDGVREAAEAMVFLKTTNAQLSDLIGRADELGEGSAPEIVAISRSMMPDC